MPGLTSYHLKLLAAATMLIDHIGVVFYPEVDWLRMIGRLSFPLFVWLLVQGEAHTHDIGRYGLRLALLGLVAQPIYQLTFNVDRLNILFLLLLGLVCLRLSSDRSSYLRAAIWLGGAGIATVANTSYGAYGIALIAFIRHFQPTPLWWLAWIGFHLLYARLGGSFQLPATVTPIFFMLANGQRGPQARWFYGFYPGHLALLWLLDQQL